MGVPELVEAWTVPLGEDDQSTDLLRPAFLFGSTEFETRIHRRLLMTPVGDPLCTFSCIQELVSIFIDIVDGEYYYWLRRHSLIFFVLVLHALVDIHHVLHRDVSVNNILAYSCRVRWHDASDSDVQHKREDIISKKGFRRGYLIDFDYAKLLDKEKQGVSSEHRTVSLLIRSSFPDTENTQGTVPFMSLGLLREYSRPTNNFVHTVSHDLESLIYVLVWMCVLYQAPNDVREDKTIEQTCLKPWVEAKTMHEIRLLHDQKLGQLLEDSVQEDFTPYFQPMAPFIFELYDLTKRSRDPRDNTILTCDLVKDVLMRAFETVQEVPEFGVTNARAQWKNVKREAAQVNSTYCSEGRNVRRKVV